MYIDLLVQAKPLMVVALWELKLITKGERDTQTSLQVFTEYCACGMDACSCVEL